MSNPAQRVYDLMIDSLFTEQEPRDGAVLVESVRGKFGFHPGRLEKNKAEIAKLIREVVPDAFLKGGGGGAQFTHLCVDRNGRQWAEHATLDAFIALAMGTGQAGICLPFVVFDPSPVEAGG